MLMMQSFVCCSSKARPHFGIFRQMLVLKFAKNGFMVQTKFMIYQFIMIHLFGKRHILRRNLMFFGGDPPFGMDVGNHFTVSQV